MSGPILSVENLCCRFEQIQALEGVSFDVEPGQLVCVVGHSGCGKSTLLRCIAGLLTPQAGEIHLRGQAVDGPRADCGMVFQDHRLLPWLRVRDNVAFGLDDLPKPDRRRLADAQLELVGLTSFADAWPRQLSGGMAQRVALARALAPRPALLLLDEPLGALDALTRAKLQDDLLRIQREEGLSMVLVTHDVHEAVYLGDRIVVLSPRPGTVREILSPPRSETADRTAESFGNWVRQLSAALQF